tara:strand:- start:134 stop:274 length:141 start_codon:yes stop_codon:yes gene_type:complete
MTKNQFLWLCNSNTIDPNLALENYDLRKALQTSDDVKVEKIIREEF